MQSNPHTTKQYRININSRNDRRQTTMFFAIIYTTLPLTTRCVIHMRNDSRQAEPRMLHSKYLATGDDYAHRMACNTCHADLNIDYVVWLEVWSTAELSTLYWIIQRGIVKRGSQHFIDCGV